MTEITESPNYWFSGHETFTLRHAWLPKAVKFIREQPDLFQKDESLVTLGVGKNMVRSIRHWAIATGVLAEGEMIKGTRAKSIDASHFGMMLFGGKGIDRYLEDPATLWLLHWRLASTKEGPTTWWWAFNEFPENEFTKDRFLSALRQHVERSGYKRVAESSLNADVTCFIRTYLAPMGPKAVVLEDTLDCPLTELSLLHELDDGVRPVVARRHSFDTGTLRYFTVEFVEPAALDKEAAKAMEADDAIDEAKATVSVLKREQREIDQRIDLAKTNHERSAVDPDAVVESIVQRLSQLGEGIQGLPIYPLKQVLAAVTHSMTADMVTQEVEMQVRVPAEALHDVKTAIEQLCLRQHSGSPIMAQTHTIPPPPILATIRCEFERISQKPCYRCQRLRKAA